MIHPAIRAELAPSGVLRAGINMGNFLLVTGTTAGGEPDGVSPDMAREIARHLDVPVRFIPYPDPGELADGAARGEWDIGNIGAEPARARTIAFTAAYCEIRSTYLVPAGSPLQNIADVDRTGIRIATKGRAAYGLWLADNIRYATLVTTDSIDESFDVFVEQGLEALAGLHPRLIRDVTRLEGARLLEGQFSAVQQAVGTPVANTRAASWLAQVIETLKAQGFVAALIDRHKVNGLSVAPPAP